MGGSRMGLILAATTLLSLFGRAAPFASRPPATALLPGRTAEKIGWGRLRAVGRPSLDAVEGSDEASPDTGIPPFADAANERLVTVIKGGIDFFMEDRDFARFYALETVARVPYFAYLSVLHLKETLGWWREPVLLRIHFAEAWNELHHLRIMEALGGNERFADRFLAQHAAFAYFWAVVALYLFAPEYAYNLNGHVERHAFETYDHYLHDHGAWLKTQPVPEVARRYYETGELYLFDSFQTGVTGAPRRPRLESLYDVFCAVRDDEREHALTMAAFERNLDAALSVEEDIALKLERVTKVPIGDEAVLTRSIEAALGADQHQAEPHSLIGSEGEVA